MSIIVHAAITPPSVLPSLMTPDRRLHYLALALRSPPTLSDPCTTRNDKSTDAHDTICRHRPHATDFDGLSCVKYGRYLASREGACD